MFSKLLYYFRTNVIGFWYAYTTTKNSQNRIYNDCVIQNLIRRPNNYISYGYEESMKDCDYTINGKPVWVEIIPDNEFLNIKQIFSSLSLLSAITPFTSPLIDVVENSIFGYMIIIPNSFANDNTLKKFIIGHELGHIEYNHIEDNNASNLPSVVNDIKKEIAADKYSRQFTGFDEKTCIICLERMYYRSLATTIDNIPQLYKKYKNKIVELNIGCRRYNKTYKERKKALVTE